MSAVKKTFMSRAQMFEQQKLKKVKLTEKKVVKVVLKVHIF